MTATRSTLRFIWLAGAVPLTWLAGCAGVPVSQAAPVPESSVAAAAAAPVSKPTVVTGITTHGLRPFNDIVKDARRIDGLLTLWQRDEKVWIELRPEDLSRPFFLSPKLKTGIGESAFLGGLMGDESVVEFRRVHNQMQLIARNTEYVAAVGTPAARAVEAAFSPSLLGSTAVLSTPHPERQSVLIEANALFINDLQGAGMQLQRVFRQGYSLDSRNSAITSVRATPELVVVEALNHFYASSVSPPSFGGPSVPSALPDARSMFLTMHYSLARLPQVPMPPRQSDARVGYFTSSVADFSDDVARTPRQRFVNRWRLEKKDPSAALSEPVKPITFWLDRSIPEKYRAPIIAGVLEWNKAFEQIGFKNAIRAEVQPDDADWDTLDFGRASIRWMTNARASFGAIGPSHVDPRSGEILDADIAIESLSSRHMRSARAHILGIAASADPQTAPLSARAIALCDYADKAAEQLGYGVDVLEARGEIDAGGPQAQKFVEAYLKDTTMHEVGHTLGLRHNFRSSRIHSDEQLSDPYFTATHALTGSVMEYAPINLPAPNAPPERRGEPFNTTLGPYDYWAIEYAYKPMAADAESAELSRIAARSNEPQLAYGTDEDNVLGVDPETLQFDLGNDPIAFAKKRVAIARDLLARQEARKLLPDQNYSVLRRSVAYALRDMGRAADVLTRQIGGVRTLRDHYGSGRDPLMPVAAADQRAALDVLAASFLSADSLNVSPSLQRKLATDYQERTDAMFRGEAMGSTDFSMATQVIDLQRGVLNQLMSDSVASRLLDSERKSPKDALRLMELYTRLSRSVWSELGRDADIPASRRELQREHVGRIAAMLVRPAALSRADARSLLRAQAQTLHESIESAASSPKLSSEARAHLRDSADTLMQALTAKMSRAGV